MARIAYDNLPDWAKEKIRDAGDKGLSQTLYDNETLSIRNGEAVYNGKVVGKPGEAVDESGEEETIDVSELPAWARSKVRSYRGSSLNMVNSNGALQIAANGIARFNGKLVVSKAKPSSFIWRVFRQMLPF